MTTAAGTTTAPDTPPPTGQLVDAVAEATERSRSAGVVRSLFPFLRLLGPHRRLLLVAILSGFLHHAFAIAGAVTGAYLVGLAVTGSSLDELRPGLILLAALVIPQGVAPWLETQLAHVAAFRVLADIRGQIYAAFGRLAPGYLIDRRSGDLAASAVSDVEELESFFAHTLSPLVVACTVPLGALGALGLVHWTLPLVLAPLLVLLVWLPALLRRRAQIHGDAVRATIGKLNAEVVDGVQGAREIISFGAGPRQLAKLLASSRAVQSTKLVHSDRAGREQAATEILTTIALLAILCTAGLLVTVEQISFPALPVAVILAAFTFRPVTAVADVVRDLAVVAAAGRRIETILTAPVPVRDLVTQTVPGPIEPHIGFDAVSFRYAEDLPDAVHDVTFDVRPGETVALVGHSGAGKSTLSHLLMRFWDTTSGTITIGGHDVRLFPQEQLRELITIVSQDVYLFNATIADNIALGDATADQPQITQAAEQSLADKFISGLPEGYATKTGERGVQLSGGQGQRIAIARALLKNSPILILDEAVSSLDAENELAVHEAMNVARQGRTTLVIAHRLSTIRAADRVIMLDHGHVVASGTHDDLIATFPEYTRLLAAQHESITSPDNPNFIFSRPADRID